MPHRPADSRLLSNLLSHEKDYVRSLHSQLDYGQASLASFSAYAAASPPPASRAIGSVATALVGAQDALRGYVLAVEEWCEQLKMLKDMEDEVGNIARDREILVDRLIKASKSNNPKRRSLLPSSPSNQGSPNPSHSGHALDQLTFNNSKLSLAQTELQACETHLTEKERMLAQMRESCILGGLKMRCRALAECGLGWSEVGKIGLQALDSSASRGSLDRSILVQKPLPDITSPYQRPSSDLSSSLAPSQSASQIFHPTVASEQYHPSASSSSGPVPRGPAPEADIRDQPRLELRLPPAHAISEEDHYTLPQARIPERVVEDDEAGGSSLEEDDDEQQYEVHENPLFAHPLATKGKERQGGSGTALPLRRPKRLNSVSVTNLPTSISAPLPSPHAPAFRTRHQSIDLFGTSSSGKTSSDGHQGSPRTRKRSTFLGLGAITGIFHRRSATAPTAENAGVDGMVSSSPSKKEKWRTRIDNNLKKSGKGGGDSSDDEAGAGARPGPVNNPIPSYLVPSTESRALSPSESRNLGEDAINARSVPKRTPSTGKKLRKISDGVSASAQGRRSISGPGLEDVQAPQHVNGVKNSDIRRTNVTSGATSPSVSRSSTIKSSSSARPASLDLHPKVKRTVALSDAGYIPPGNKQRRRTSSPPTTGQTSLLSIVEDVTRQNRQGWLQTNPNNLLVEVKAPQSVYHTLNLEGPIPDSPTIQRTSFDASNTGNVVGRRRESSLRHQILNDYRRNSLSASSSEPSLPLKRLPPTPGPKTPLRSALRNRSATPSPATLTPPRAASPSRNLAPLPNGAPLSAAPRPPAVRNDSGGSSGKDDDTASAYETGHEEFDSESDPPTPTVRRHPNGQGYQEHRRQHSLPNGHILSSSVNPNAKSDGSDTTAGTEGTPPSRRKSVRVSLEPTFSPTPPALTDYEEDRSPWTPGRPGHPSKPEAGDGSGWSSRKSTSMSPADAAWQDSSDEDEEYARAKVMLSKASRRLEKVYRGE